MVSIEEAEIMLEEIASKLPPEIFAELNGGIILLPDTVLDELGNDLYILGEYFCGGSLGRYIAIYYGSFAAVFGDLDKDEYKAELEITLKHEFTHHIESLAGEDDLDDEDDAYLAEYLRDMLE
jgi:hypothetical protein